MAMRYLSEEDFAKIEMPDIDNFDKEYAQWRILHRYSAKCVLCFSKHETCGGIRVRFRDVILQEEGNGIS